ncbi:MAG TPA: 30S ribosomal protein S6 [Firmicutes bacterium]|nr:30S ribosomal protein S6 [Bacillota bacterium]
MNKYELLFIIDNSAADEAKEAIIAKMSQLVTDNGGSVEKVDKWGAKKLAYPINFKEDGYYVLMNFECEPALIAEMERQLRINDQVMRHMVVKK